MKVVIALVLALVLLAIGIPLSRTISEGEEHTITRTVDPATERPQQKQARDVAKPKAAAATADRVSSATAQAPVTR